MHLGLENRQTSESTPVGKLPKPLRLAQAGCGPRPGLIGGIFGSAASLPFALIFTLFGAWIIAKAFGFTSNPVRPDTGLVARLFIAGFGAIFFGAGLLPLSQVFSNLRTALWRARLLLRLKKPAQWRRDYPWPKKHVIRNSNGPGFTATSIFVVAFLSYFSAAPVVVAIILLSEGPSRDNLPFVLPLLCFTAMGLLFLAGAFRELFPGMAQ